MVGGVDTFRVKGIKELIGTIVSATDFMQDRAGKARLWTLSSCRQHCRVRAITGWGCMTGNPLGVAVRG
jgi:hypothetical protein